MMMSLERFYRNLIKSYQLADAKHPILDVGSGSRPLDEADVISDLYVETTKHRSSLLITKDKPFIICTVMALPFRSKTFGFVNCMHVLEHLEEPSKALQELKRVAKHGYVETPGWFGERILFGNQAHLWVVKRKNGTLTISENRKLVVNGNTIIPFGNFLKYAFSYSKVFQALISALDIVLPDWFLVKYRF